MKQNKESQIFTPTKLSEFVGNAKVKEIISISIQAAKKNGLRYPHLLITGQRGLGKTALGSVIANEMRATYTVVSANAIESVLEFNNLLLNLPQILILDEIHGLRRNLSDLLHQAMDSFKYSYVDKETNTVCVKNIKPFTLIGLTTDPGLLTPALYSRFAKNIRLYPYTAANLQTIVMNAGRRNGIRIDNVAAYELASRSCGVPRLALSNLINLYEYALRYNYGTIDHETACAGLSLHGIDSKGLCKEQRDILKILYNSDHPIGVENIAQRIGMGIEEFTQIHEPFLISSGMIERRPHGRVITNLGREHILKNE